MKKLFCLIPLLATACNGASFALITDPTNNVPAATTNYFSQLVVPTATVKGSNSFFQATLKLTGAGTSPVTFGLDFTLDWQTWATNAVVYSVTPNGTTPVQGTIAIIAAPAGFRLGSISNPNASAVTNITASAFTRVLPSTDPEKK